MNNYNDYLDISWKEKEKIRHENKVFDEYIFIAKVPDLDWEESLYGRL